MSRLINLSKQVSFALRHHPEKYGLVMDDVGCVSIEQLLHALHREDKWADVSVEDLEEIIRTSEKKRFEIKNGKIRAFYGHSMSGKILKEERVPSDVLYHGTTRRFLESIMENGLLPQGRQYVHLSQDVETARSVGIRRDDKPVIPQIDAKSAWLGGTKFYLGNETVWLANQIAWQYMDVMQEGKKE